MATLTLRFLRLFAAFRAIEARAERLESDLKECASRRIALEDENRWGRDQIAQLTNDLRESRAKAEHSTQLVADFFCQLTTGKKLYGAAPDLPAESPDAEVIRHARSQARHVQQQETAEAIKHMMTSYENDLGIEVLNN